MQRFSEAAMLLPRQINLLKLVESKWPWCFSSEPFEVLLLYSEGNAAALN
jgi:hypothetical protein